MRRAHHLLLALLALTCLSFASSAADFEPPQLVDDLTPTRATAGQGLVFEAEVVDDATVEGVWVEYWYDEADPVNASMDPTVT
ncbi:MAG: hypothetical protein JSW25_01170, partial [Thermoplasmata archaeon]